MSDVHDIANAESSNLASVISRIWGMGLGNWFVGTDCPGFDRMLWSAQWRICGQDVTGLNF